MLSLDLRRHDEVVIGEVRHRFVKELSGDRALFVRDDTDGERIMTEREIEDEIRAGTMRFLTDFRSRSGHRSERNDDDAIGPDGPADPRARARAFYVREWDRNQTSLSTKALDEFIARAKRLPGARDLGWTPSAGSLRRAISGRGEIDHRPLRVMQSRTGKAPGKKQPFRERLIRKAVAFYYRARSHTIVDAYALLHFRMSFWNEAMAGRAREWTASAIPTYETLRVRIRQAECYDTWATKTSVIEAHRKFKGTREGLSASRILEVVVIDSTVDDVFLVDLKRNMPLGKPTVTYAIDVHSRQPGAIVVTFEPMSLYTVMSAVVEINTPKSHWRDEDPSLKNDFDCWGRPLEIVVDNAWEQTGVSFQETCFDAGTHVHWAPIHNPEYKAVVERFIHTMQTLVTHKLRGGVPLPPQLMRKLNLKPSDDACMSRTEYLRLLRKAVVDTYQMEGHASLAHPPALMWRKSKELHRRPFIKDLGFLAATAGRTGKATVTREGVRHGGHRFHDPDATSKLLDDLARGTPQRERRIGSATAAVKIKLDPANCESIHVWNDARKRYVRLPNVDRAYFDDGPVSWAQDALIKAYARAENLDFRSERDRWAARNGLRAEMALCTGHLRSREMKDARRVNDPPSPITAPIEFGSVAPSTFGSEAQDLEVTPAGLDRADGGMPERGARRGRPKRAKSGSRKPERPQVPPDSGKPDASPGAGDGSVEGLVWATRAQGDWVTGKRRRYDA